ncbi:P-loop containing nucleoside triphosphate hydrolase protein [Triangularia verruculosa]|uniref:P-loop containing nucleoside triphosphate hydrolase protein n=1 Tax=Triangularia verruculosa TaxID=2587418 RepID=A0AAN6XKF1_9PEZI|nr:P-loop containing nucleoside triphosphate hydrolase protein [Triangularia verruculosa]
MTSANSASATTILCTCKQTRFHISDRPNYREVDVSGLNITIVSAASNSTSSATAKKGKGKAGAEGTEILSNAELKLKAGARYALVGRNGAGKSTLLRAISEKLIPGIPEEVRVGILQQTGIREDADDDEWKEGGAETGGQTVLEQVVDSATAKGEVEKDIKRLAKGVNDPDPYGAVRAVRKLKFERMQKKLFILDKDARLRSGARGLQARKALVEFEKEVEKAEKLNDQPEEEISAEILQAEIQEATDMLAELELQVEPTRLADIESQAKRILAGLGFTDAYMARPADSLSGGWQMRSNLAVVLLQETDILILDEPTNFLDLLGIIWLQKYLEGLEDLHPTPPTLILVSHDRDFTSAVCTDLIVLKDKALTYFHGDLPTYEAAQAERKIYLTKMKEAQDKQKSHIQDSIQKNMAAGRKNDDQNKLRQAKSRQKKLDDRWGMQVNAKGHKFKLNRDMAGWHESAREAIDIPKDDKAVSISLPLSPDLRFPGPLISLENVGFRYKIKGRPAHLVTPTLQNITLSVSMGDRVGIVGLNGAGKSTLIRLLVSDPSSSTLGSMSGTVQKHPRLKLGYYSQHAVTNLLTLGRATPSLTALTLLMSETTGVMEEPEVRGLLGSLGLPGRLASDVPLTKLSGGQLVRCELARLLWSHPHCLVLDEPTTHLDYETVTALREALRYWPGAVVLVSHDRWFVKGAVENLKDEDVDSDGEAEDDDEDEEEQKRRRLVYKLVAGKEGGKMTLLDKGGVSQFEEGVEKKVRKMMAT